MPPSGFLARPSLRWFFLVSFGVPWLGWTIVALTGLGDSPLGTALFYTGDFMTVGGFVATWVAAGRPGVMSLLRRCVQVAAPVRWALVAMFLPFVWIGLALVGYGLTHSLAVVTLAMVALVGPRLRAAVTDTMARLDAADG